MTGKAKVVMMNPKDNVAMAVENLAAGERIELAVAGEKKAVTLKNDIPFGHKFALRTIKKEEMIIKYGQTIGAATSDIAAGEHVHIHNVESCRGRGDKEEAIMQTGGRRG